MSAPLTVYDHIDANNRKTWLLIALFPLSLALLVWAACYLALYAINDPEFTRQGLVLLAKAWPGAVKIAAENNFVLMASFGYLGAALLPIVVIALGWMAISYFFGDKMMLGFAGAQPLRPEDNPEIYRHVENVAIMAGLPMPKVYLINDESMNAFATGHSPDTASVALTSGIIKRLTPLELEAVIAHEMGHIGNRDIRLNLLIITGLSIFGFLADMVRLSLYSRRSGNSKNNQAQVLIFFIVIALLIFNFAVAPLIRLAVSRTREYAADATGALITRNPQQLALALAKIAQDSRVEVLDKSPRMAIACIAEPNSLNQLTSTHPSIKSRIERLMQMSGMAREED